MSSRLTSAEIIAQGHYLDPEFDPSTLTVAQLLGVFGFHNVNYPTTYTKPKLLQVFTDEVKHNAKKFKRERLSRQNSLASEDGITNGHTGKPLNEGKAVAPVRRSSRRVSRPASREPEPEVAKPEPPKRRRSSAEPSLGGPSRRRTAKPVEPVLHEESEPEEEVVVRKVSRSKKSAAGAGTQARRLAQDEVDSGWEDNNIFQSGAESSSPVRPSPVRPHYLLSPTKGKEKVQPATRRAPSVKPPESKFEPDLPAEATRETRARSARASVAPEPVTVVVRPIPEEEEDEQPEAPFEQHTTELVEAEVGVSEEPLSEEVLSEPEPATTGSFEQMSDQDKVIEVSRRFAGQGDLVRVRAPPAASSMPSLYSITLFVMTLAASYFAYEYKHDAAQIGFCETGQTTNEVLRTFQARPSTMTCETGYLIRPHQLLFFLPLSASPNSAHSQNAYTLPTYFPPASSSCTTTELVYKGISRVLDGLPGFGPVALPPRCVEDPKRKARVGALGNAIDTLLASHRGKLVCDGVEADQRTESESEEAKRWGLEMEDLKEKLKTSGMKRKLAPRLMEAFEENFNEAIQQLLTWGGVILGEDSSGKRYVAHKTLKMDWACAAKVKVRESWKQWRNQIFGMIMSALALVALRQRRARSGVESRRVATLVQTALESMRNQELAHHTDPVTAPHPYLSSLQLRDLILQDEHSVGTRRRLWERVERVVEANANVRTNLEEVAGGDEMRVWRWVGGAGTLSPGTERPAIFSADDELKAEA
ncbi:hypothetical protein EUX98_g2065 [Antrodiella citrinella]|uniref:Man1/Src1 C-terminal domain-containing protein n=1 Tax=Antrodiella citrinella TaxID=2447956 RepID=A0A4S4MZX2_9APHY|nr:hypothetical protein EUX98_g2065 [Antrodiella citrinella]